jgi:hypothetical protein
MRWVRLRRELSNPDDMHGSVTTQLPDFRSNHGSRVAAHGTWRGVAVALLLLAAGSLQAWPWSKQADKEKSGPDSTVRQTAMPGQPADTIHATYLDTLNRGREVSLGASDVTPAPAVALDTTGQKPAEAPLPPAFRVQCLASTQLEMVRGEQKSLESKVRYPVHITFSAPYYKLLVGDFPDREGAQKALLEVKGLGYPDAWIVSGKPAQKP